MSHPSLGDLGLGLESELARKKENERDAENDELLASNTKCDFSIRDRYFHRDSSSVYGDSA